MFTSESGIIQWEVVHGLLKNAIYGGRIDDHQDFKKMETYLVQYFNHGDFYALIL